MARRIMVAMRVVMINEQEKKSFLGAPIKEDGNSHRKYVNNLEGIK